MIKLLKRLCVAGMSVVAWEATAQESRLQNLEFDVEVDIVSKYVWRGQVLTDDPVVQPGATVSLGGLSLNVWASIDTTGTNEQSGKAYRLQEVNYTVSYALAPMEGLDLAGGFIVYDFPGTGFATTTELFGEVRVSAFPLGMTLAVYYDVDEVQGWYANLSVDHDIRLSDTVNLSVGAGLGYADADYNDAYFGVSRSGVEDFTLSAGIGYVPSEIVSFSVYFGYSRLIDSALQDAAGDADVVIFGVNSTFTF